MSKNLNAAIENLQLYANHYNLRPSVSKTYDDRHLVKLSTRFGTDSWSATSDDADAAVFAVMQRHQNWLTQQKRKSND